MANGDSHHQYPPVSFVFRIDRSKIGTSATTRMMLADRKARSRSPPDAGGALMDAQIDDGEASTDSFHSESARKGDEDFTFGDRSTVSGKSKSNSNDAAPSGDRAGLREEKRNRAGVASPGRVEQDTPVSSSGVEKAKGFQNLVSQFEGEDEECAEEAIDPPVSGEDDGALVNSLQSRPGAFRVEPGGPRGGRSVRGLLDDSGETWAPEREAVASSRSAEAPPAAYDGETYLVEASLVREESAGQSDVNDSSTPGRRSTLPLLVVAQPLRRSKRLWIGFGVGSLLVIGLAIGVAFAVMKTRSTLPNEPSAEPPISVTGFFKTLPEYTLIAMRNATSPQANAFQWLNSSEPKDLSLSQMTQRFALATFGFATGANKKRIWTNSTGWLDATVDVCNWHGCVCPDDSKTVRTLGLNENHLAGTIPREIGLLSMLTDLGLAGNMLDGSIPTEIKLLNESLVALDVSSNGLTGTLPTELGLLTGLMTLGLSRNSRIRGPLPTELGLLSVLSGLWLDHVSLSSSIPTEFGNLQSLQKFASGDAGLSGPIPTELGRLTKLRDVDLSMNKLSSTLPSELGRLSLLNSLRLHENLLSDNGLNGTIPSEILALPSLMDLELHSNLFSGSIPSNVGELSQVKTLYLGYNFLTSTIPTEMGLLSNLEDVSFHYNGLSGMIPTEFGQLTRLKQVDFGMNYLNGTVPEELCQLIQNGVAVNIDCELVECSCSCKCDTTQSM
jgi:Leucine-rich repeat (LRR) protein